MSDGVPVELSKALQRCAAVDRASGGLAPRPHVVTVTFTDGAMVRYGAVPASVAHDIVAKVQAGSVDALWWQVEGDQVSTVALRLGDVAAVELS